MTTSRPTRAISATSSSGRTSLRSTDTYGYNRDDAAAKDFPVHDLMVEFQLEPSDEGTFVVEMSDDQTRLSAVPAG